MKNNGCNPRVTWFNDNRIAFSWLYIRMNRKYIYSQAGLSCTYVPNTPFTLTRFAWTSIYSLEAGLGVTQE